MVVKITKGNGSRISAVSKKTVQKRKVRSSKFELRKEVLPEGKAWTYQTVQAEKPDTERMKDEQPAQRMEDITMKKAILVTALNFFGVIAVWVFLELLYTQFTDGVFVKNLLNPVYMIPASIAAIITAVFAFMDEKKKVQEIGTYCR